MELGFSFFAITLSSVRIVHDKINTISHSYDHFSYLATAFTNRRRDFKVCNSIDWMHMFVLHSFSAMTPIISYDIIIGQNRAQTNLDPIALILTSL